MYAVSISLTSLFTQERRTCIQHLCATKYTLYTCIYIVYVFLTCLFRQQVSCTSLFIFTAIEFVSAQPTRDSRSMRSITMHPGHVGDMECVGGSTLQHTATHCNTLQSAATRCNTARCSNNDLRKVKRRGVLALHCM